MTEHVRGLAAAIARFDTYDAAGQGQLKHDYPGLATVGEARGALGTACQRLRDADMEAAWPDPLHHTLAHAVVTETAARVVPERGDPDAPLEVRMLAQGTPLGHALRVEFRADLALIREWLLCRLDQADGLADCALRQDVAAADVPPPLPAPPPDSTEKATIAEAQQIAEAATALATAMTRFLTDAACATLNPPCGDCTDTDVLLAHVELDGCDVVRVCSATREQVLPGGSAYGEWLPKLYRLRELAERVCCQPLPVYRTLPLPTEGPVARPYADGLLGDWPRGGDLEEMLSLLLTPAPGETPPKALHEQVYTTPSEVTDSMQELARLRTQVADLTAAVEGLRSHMGSTQTQVTHLEEQLGDREDTPDPAPGGGADQAPDQAPDRADEPPKPPAKRARSPRTRNQKPGETP
ncbi:LigA protein [Streptomyces himastatinicus ATCC 53653]|uniref:LigA protein n=1 Tax=Streptomyces himastatinicus ATCC 53653 TaxID=457427 RepID=D9WJ36_9ACTN|nr:hypothetical protein [Streptomyces himastatinicus]EFL29133.1 LigA protein [Streptomyces himastatinicus ATCC 53653]